MSLIPHLTAQKCIYRPLVYYKKVEFKSVILRDKTMDYKLMSIHNNDKQTAPYVCIVYKNYK